ncbi:hypothetical protein G6F59_016816 [Rhizopus arrhizus]|nr:hypothetical protein G6F59_016816 [Rhizopus arrhizus]
MIYVDPALIQQILGGRPLPFIAGGLSADPRLHAASEALLQSTRAAIDPLQEDDALYDLAHALCAAAGRPQGRRRADYPAAERARQPRETTAGACRAISAPYSAPAPIAT